MLARDLLVASGMLSGHESLHEALSAFKRQLIADTLAMCDGNRSRAASALGIERTSLLRLIRDLHIPVGPAPPSGRPRGEVVPHAFMKTCRRCHIDALRLKILESLPTLHPGREPWPRHDSFS